MGSAADIDALLHPARAFKHPMDVVRDDHLTLVRKTRDPFVMGIGRLRRRGSPELRQLSPTGQVKFDDIMDALRGLDCELERRVCTHQHQAKPTAPGAAP